MFSLKVFHNTPFTGLEPKLYRIAISRTVLYGEIICGVDKGVDRNCYMGGLQIIWGGLQFFEPSKKEGYNFLNFSEGEGHVFFQP